MNMRHSVDIEFADKMRLTLPLSNISKRIRDSLTTLPGEQLTCSG